VVRKSDLLGQKGPVFIRIFKEVHSQDHGILVCLRFNGRDSPITAQLVDVAELESVLAVLFFRQEITVSVAKEFNKEGFAISRFPHEYVRHFFG